MANNDRESLHIFWTTWGISMKFSGKMWLLMILKVTKNQALTHSLEKRQRGGGGGGSNWPSCSLFRVKMDFCLTFYKFQFGFAYKCVAYNKSGYLRYPLAKDWSTSWDSVENLKTGLFYHILSCCYLQIQHDLDWKHFQSPV